MADDSRVLYAVDIPGTTIERLERAGYEIVSGASASIGSIRGVDCVIVPRSRQGDDGLGAAQSEHPDLPVVGVGSNGDEVGDDRRAVVYRSEAEYGDLIAAVEAAIDGGKGGPAVGQTREQALESLHEATRELMTAESREDVFEVAIDAAETILGLDIATFHLAEEAVLKPVATTDATAEFIGSPPALEPDSSIAGEVFETGDPVVVDDVRDHPDVRNPDTPFRSELILPVSDHGVFLASAVDPDAFDEESEFLAKVLAANVEAALDRAARESLLRERERSLEALHDATRGLMIADSREEVAALVAETAETVLGLPLAGVWLHDREANALVPVEYPDDDRLPEDPPAFRPGESLSWDVFESGAIRTYDDLHEQEGRHNPDTQIRSEIVVPIGEYGVLNSGSTTPAAFDDTDKRLAGLLANTAASAFARVERDEERAATRRELERQNERLEEFASFLSHDLRNPLNVATGHLQLAMAEGDLERLEIVADALDRMDELTDDILTLAKRGGTVIDSEPIDLETVAEATWQSVGEAPATLAIEDDLDTIPGDRGPLVQLLENLFENAIEHAGADVEVEIGSIEDGFYVADDGPGVPPTARETVFESGYSTAETGTGFGLAIVAAVADAHGWDVTLTESATGGARFEFTGVT